MKLMSLLLCLVMVSACALAQPKAKVINQTAETVRSSLSALEVPPFMFDQPGVTFTQTTNTPELMTWALLESGVSLMQFDAKLVAVTPDTTAIDVTLTGSKPEIVKRLKDNPEVANLYLVAMKERIFSTLEDRPFDMMSIAPATRAAGMANMKEINAMFDAASESHAKSSADNIAAAYAKEGVGK